MLSVGQSLTSNQLRWLRYIRGWWAYYQLAEERFPIFQLEGWIRRHIRKCFWLRWHHAAGRERALRKLGVHPRLWKTVRASRGAWFMAAASTGLPNVLVRFGERTARVTFAGLAPGLIGLYPFNVVVPDGVNGDTALTLSIDGVASTPSLFFAAR